MKASNFLKLAMAAALVVGIGSMVSTDTNAADGTTGSSVQIGTPLTVTGQEILDWGIMAAPTSGTDFWVMDCTDGLTGGLAANDLFAADHQSGEFLIQGQNSASLPTISASVTNGFADLGLNLHAANTCGVNSGNLSVTGDLTVTVGASLDIRFDVIADTYTGGEITLTANY